MKNKWKAAALTSLMIAPAAVVYADDTPTGESEPVETTPTGDNASGAAPQTGQSEAEEQSSTPTGEIEPTQTDQIEAETRALLYFKNLHMDSSLIDTSIYAELLTNAFPDEKDPKRVLLQEKLNYIQSYKSLTLTAESLKTEISKLTLTNQTLKEDVETA